MTNKSYDIYEDITFKRRIDTIPKGGTYKLLDASGVYKQVYYYGRGNHSVLGWIKEGTGIKGDVDGNGKVDKNDLTVLTQYMTNKSVSIDLDNADMNGDGKITSVDVSQLSAKFQPSQNFSVVHPANGLYSLQPMCAPNKELTVKNASTANSANVFIWSINSDWHTQLSHQKWYVTRIGNSDWYKITAENSGKALNVHNGIAVNGTNVDIYPYGGKMHQFRFIDTGNGYYAIQANVGDLNSASYVLDVEGAGSTDGTNVSIHQFTNNSAQRWKLIKRASGLAVATVSNGWYKISPMHALSKCLDVENGKDVNQVNIQLWDWGNVNNQKFYLQNVGDGYFTLKTGCSSNRYIDVQWGNTTAGTNLWQYEKEPTNNTAQKFRLLDAGNGYYYIEPKVKAGLAFDCAGGGSVNGTNVQLWTRENNNWYKWKFTGVSAPVNNSPSQDTTKNINAKLDSLIASWKGKKWDNRESSKIGSTCFGFANYIFREINGVIAGSSYNSGRYKLINKGYGVKEVYSTTNATYNNMHNFLLTLNSGAFIQGNKASGNKQHSMIFCSYNANNKTIKVFDANWATNPDNVVRVHDFTLSKFIERFPRVSFYQK